MRSEGKVVDCPELPVSVIKNPTAIWTLIHELDSMTLYRGVKESDIPELQSLRGNWHYIRTGWFVDFVERLAELELVDFVTDAPAGLLVFRHPCPVPYDGIPIFPVGGPSSKWLIIGQGTVIPAVLGNLKEALAWRANNLDGKSLRIEAHEAPDAFCDLIKRWKRTLEGSSTDSSAS